MKDMHDQKGIKKEIERLQKIHHELEEQIRALMIETIADHLKIQRAKKQKLDLKDQIQALKNKLHPDIIA
jgi:hypothetical protein